MRGGGTSAQDVCIPVLMRRRSSGWRPALRDMNDQLEFRDVTVSSVSR